MKLKSLILFNLFIINCLLQFLNLYLIKSTFDCLNCTNILQIAGNFNAILRKKAELNQMPDTGRKKQQINIKDNFWHATPRSKTTIEAWFKDLAGSKPLTSLAKKVS